ncbi:ferredoxin [Saliterribacillus persicus]|uniref:Ferredoxin n=1 Tax=Saliterribacillus persicus TaxID=930114 RepID=A0A368XA90_9BACI|nr:ferredoxin [Saliterribacillus persicus]RCW64881.1 ferredoxin [Saliterribacillus persicus]
MAYYTWIDRETCIACGVCGATAPQLYDYDDEGIAYAHRDNNKGNLKVDEQDHEDMFDSSDGCPTESVIIKEQKET